jgi:predicted restriction endonuclease
MNNLEQYLDNYDNKELTNEIYNMYKFFLYKNEDLYLYHLKFLLENIYSIKIIEYKRKRLNQKEFRNQILQKFNNTCIISGVTCIDELTAAHIIPINEIENYDIDNGLLLLENLHKTYDKYYWSINPDLLQIEINNNINVGTIKQYNNLKITLQMNNMLYSNLKTHYDIFLSKLFI